MEQGTVSTTSFAHTSAAAVVLEGGWVEGFRQVDPKSPILVTEGIHLNSVMLGFLLWCKAYILLTCGVLNSVGEC